MLNYIGSKHTLLPFITSTIEEVVGDTRGKSFADIFAGTGSVSQHFKKLGAEVISNDLQHYSYVINKHLIENSEVLDESLFQRYSNLAEDGFIYENYCSPGDRKYFTDENGRVIDGVRKQLEKDFLVRRITEAEYYWVLGSLLESADKVANTASVYGSFLKNYKKTAQKPLTLSPLPIVEGFEGQVFNEDANSLIKKIEGDILYLDPPYNHRQYSSNYHILETISRYDNPEVRGKTGLRELSENRSDYSSKRKAREAMHDLLKNADFEYTFISYNNEGIITLSEMREMMEEFGNYDLIKTEYKRFRADKREAREHKADKTVEYLHILSK